MLQVEWTCAVAAFVVRVLVNPHVACHLPAFDLESPMELPTDSPEHIAIRRVARSTGMSKSMSLANVIHVDATMNLPAATAGRVRVLSADYESGGIMGCMFLNPVIPVHPVQIR